MATTHKSYKKSYFKLSLLLIFSATILIYGFLIGRYEVFPFDFLKSLTESEQETIQREQERLFNSEKFSQTSLQRLYINKVGVEDKADGGGMVVIGKDVIIVDRHGYLFTLDFQAFTKRDIPTPTLPMGLSELERDGWSSREDHNPEKVRVTGAYADPISDQEINLYVSHHFYNGECFSLKLSRLKLFNYSSEFESAGEWQEVFKTSPCMYPDKDLIDVENNNVHRWVFAGHISGGSIIEYDKEHLLMSVGDHFYDGYDKEIFAQDETNLYGKFILINKETGEYNIYAKGTRNAQGLYKDEYGVIWSTEHGPNGGDELNIIIEGENYGWPIETLGIQYNNNPWLENENQGRHDHFNTPVYAWVPSIAPSQLMKVESNKFELWDGDLLVTTLKDRSIHRLRPDPESKRILYDERIEIGHRIRNIVELYDGSYLLRTDDSQLIHIDDAGPVYEYFDYDTYLMENEIARRFYELEGSSEETTNLDEKALVFGRYCGYCHATGEMSLTGPHLNGLANREVGSVEGFDYSTALENSDQVWDEKLLRNYTRSPESTFPGTSMGKVGLTDEELDLIVDYLLNN